MFLNIRERATSPFFIFMVSNFSKRSVNIVEVLNMKTCKICGCSFDEENFEGIIVNEGMDNEYHVCWIVSRLSVTTDILSPVKPAVHIFRRINCTTKRSRVIPLPRVQPAGKMW